MENGNNIQLSLQLLGYTLKARGAKVKHKQMQRFLDFVNFIFLPPH